MFGLFTKRKNNRIDNMIIKVPSLSDKDLLLWFQYAHTDVQVSSKLKDVELLSTIELELENRGFQYKLDY